MWHHFGGTLTLKSDDGRGAGGDAGRQVHVRVRLDKAVVVDTATCGQELRVDGRYVWARIAQLPHC